MSSSSEPRWWRRLTLRDVIVLTLPPLALALWFLGAAVLDYHRVRQFDDWWSAQTSVRKFAWNRGRAALRTPRMAELDRRLTAEDESEPLLRLMVDRHDWDRIGSDVGAHWGEWIDAMIVDGNDTLDAELRWRGDGSAHWSTEKKSFTLKTKRGELYKGFRSMAFSVKDVLPQWLVGTLAKDFGLLAPEQQLVPVYVNDRFYGLHRFVEPVDESFLRRNLRMPGNVFRADTAERGDYFKGLPREVFANPHIWDRAANNDRPGAFGTSLLAEFLKDLNTSDFEGHQRFMSWLDRDELSRLLAFLLIVGDPYHMSGVHNQLWYEDPTSGTLHPVVWDVRLLDLDKPPPHSNINRFWRAALKDPRIWDGAMREVAKWLEGDKLMKLAEERVNGAWQRFGDEFAYDMLRAGVVPPVGDPEVTLATLRKNVETLRGWLSDASASVTIGRTQNGRDFVIDVIVDGRAPCAMTMFDVELSTDSQAVFDGFYRDRDADGVRDAEDEQLACATEVAFGSFKPHVELPSSIGGIADRLDPQPVHYRFLYEPSLTAGSATDVRVKLINALDGRPIEVTRSTAGARVAAGSAWNPGLYERREPAPVVLSGEVTLDRDLILEEGRSLRVEAGTTLRLAPNVSIEVRGRAEFRGSEHKPITIERANPELPWGVIAVQGAGGNGSEFEHVKFLGGGGRQVARVEYKGAVAVHNAFGVVFDHCEFAYNSRCDDLINVVKGEASITNSHFHHANADSIDYDMSGGLVAHNLIEGSGNDGLDLMTCWPRVIDNTILNSGDKGISVGEDSSPLVFDNVIRGCVRGIEVKDRSSPTVLNTSIEGCGHGVYAHMKNWRYGEAGWPVIARSSVSGNQTEYLAEDGARRTLAAAQIGPVSDQLPRAEDLAWLLGELGIRGAADTLGPIDGYELVEPLAPLYEGSFDEDFIDPTNAWSFEGGVTRLNKRAHDLVASFESTRGRVSTRSALDLSDSSRDYLLVIEVAGEGLANATFGVLRGDTALSAPIELDPDPMTYRFGTLALTPGNYDGLFLEAEPSASRARLRLHTWRVLARPRTGAH